MRHAALAVAALLFTAGAASAQTHTPTIDELISLKRVGAAAISPNAQWVAYTVREANWDENNYHTDGLWRLTPAMGCVLRCLECPPVGGDTIWVNMVEAYRLRPDDVKAKIDGLRARHSIEASFGAAMPIEKRLALKTQYPDPEHPVVRTHPETGEKVLFVNAFTTHFTNFHTAANVRYGHDYSPGGSELLNYLIRQAYIPEYQVRWRWTKNSFAIWDNRCTQHYAVQDYFPDVRKMERAGIVGEPTF